MLAAATLSAGAFDGAPARAQSQGIAATVNSDIITVYDLNSRIKLALASLRVPDRQDFRRRLAPQVLRRLIVEKLQMQEARRLNLKVSDADVENFLRTIERQRGLPKGGFLKRAARAGIPSATILHQIRASLAWNLVIRRAIRPQIRVTEAEVEDVIARNAANRNRVQYRISEIYLPVSEASQEASVLRTANRIMNLLRRGAPFGALARQFSGASTAAVGGDRGLVFEGQMDSALLRAVKRLRPGQVAGPIRTITGYYIVQLRARGTLVTRRSRGFAQAGYRFDRQSRPADRARARQALTTLVRRANSCQAFIAGARAARANISNYLTAQQLGRMSPQIRQRLTRLKPGAKTGVMGNQAILVAVMKCRKSGADLPTRAAVRRSLVLQKINVRARNYLRDLRRAAIVEIRV